MGSSISIWRCGRNVTKRRECCARLSQLRCSRESRATKVAVGRPRRRARCRTLGKQPDYQVHCAARASSCVLRLVPAITPSAARAQENAAEGMPVRLGGQRLGEPAFAPMTRPVKRRSTTTVHSLTKPVNLSVKSLPHFTEFRFKTVPLWWSQGQSRVSLARTRRFAEELDSESNQEGCLLTSQPTPR
jgi:hypothetical protein